MPIEIHVVKALCRATSKTMLIRAKSVEAALKKASRLKEHRQVDIEFVWIESRPDDRSMGI